MKEIAKMINQDQQMICAVAKTETNMKKNWIKSGHHFYTQSNLKILLNQCIEFFRFSILPNMYSK